MRVTTKVIQGNSIANINTNKVLQDKLNNQMATEKKIVRPSDDPVVAIRALRLRTNVSQVTQYYEKNVADAESWMKVTEDSLTTVSSVITDMIEQCTKGSSEKLTATDRDTILDALKALRDEVYATGNADYAGRSVFTGYRTETTVKFTASESRPYQITEQINNNVLDSVKYINSDYLNSINDVNYKSGDGPYTQVAPVQQSAGTLTAFDPAYSYYELSGTDYVLTGDVTPDPGKDYYSVPNPVYTKNAVTGAFDPAGVPDPLDPSATYYEKSNLGSVVEQDINENEIYRIRLSYGNVDKDMAPVIKLYDETQAANPVVSERYTSNWSTLVPDVVSENDTPNPYQMMADHDAANPAEDRAILIPETGELLISKSVYEKLMKLKDDVTTPTVDESQIQITYNKTTWKKDDLKPEHYFACTDMSNTDDAPNNYINYNTDYLSGIVEKQAIEYDVGLNQSIRINTTADEVFTHAIGRDVDDLVNSMQAVIDMDATVTRLTKMRDDLKQDADYDTNYKILTNQIDAANKSLTFLKEKNQALFEGSITKMQKHLDKVNEATTNCGTREKKLDLIKNRLMSQKTNFETLESENENVEITDVALQLKGAELTYQAALMSTSKILQTSLMQYI